MEPTPITFKCHYLCERHFICLCEEYCWNYSVDKRDDYETIFRLLPRDAAEATHIIHRLSIES